MDCESSETSTTREALASWAFVLLKLSTVALGVSGIAGLVWFACTAPSAPSVAFAQPEPHYHAPVRQIVERLPAEPSPGLAAFETELQGLAHSVDALAAVETRHAQVHADDGPVIRTWGRAHKGPRSPRGPGERKLGVDAVQVDSLRADDGKPDIQF